MMTTCKRGRVLLVIERGNIYGISPEGGEVLFELSSFDFGIKMVIDLIEGSLLCIDSKGNFRLIEIFYETGVILATWHLNFYGHEWNYKNWKLEEATVHKLFEKFNLIVKLGFGRDVKVILIYSIDPLSEIVPCTFRHWIINSIVNDKNLPFIVQGTEGVFYFINVLELHAWCWG